MRYSSLALSIMLSVFLSGAAAAADKKLPAKKAGRPSAAAPAPVSPAATQAVVVSSGPDTRTDIQKFSDPDHIVRRNAVIRTGFNKRKEDLPPVLLMLDDQSVDVQRAAVNALVSINDPKAVKALSEKLKNEKNVQVKLGIIAALGDLKAESAAGQIKGFLKDPYPPVRSEALLSLGKLGLAQTYGDIVAMLSDEAESVKITAADVCGALGIKQAEGALIKNLEDPISLVRKACVSALGRLGLKSSLSSVEKLRDDSDMSVKQAAEAAYEAIKGAKK